MKPANASLKSESLFDIDWEKIRADFPILNLKIDEKPLIYLDKTATRQMQQSVIERLVRYQTTQHTNINITIH